MTTPSNADIRFLSSSELQKNLQNDASALSSNDHFVSLDELERRGEMPASAGAKLEESVSSLEESALNHIENNESEYSPRSLRACITAKQKRNIATLAWYYGVNDKQLGPVNRNELGEHARNGIIGKDNLVWREGMSDWVRAATLGGLVPQQAAPSQAKPQPPAQPPAQPQVAPQQQQQQARPQQQPYNQGQEQYGNQYPGPPPKRSAPGQLIAAGVIQFVAVPLWIIVGIIQMFSRRIDDDFLFGSMIYFLFIALLSIAMGIGYILVARWSLYMKMVLSATVIAYISYRMTISPRGEEAWLIMIFFELITLTLVLTGWKYFQKDE
jgi:hypothetical protein